MSNERIKAVVEDLEQVIQNFMRKHKITHDEYRMATDVIIDSITAGEQTLLFDVFLEAEATEIGNVTREGSPEAIEGPFYFDGAPLLSPPYVMPQRINERGEVLYFHGRITDLMGNPLSDVELDLWQADAEGLYSKIHPGIPDWNLRGRFRTDALGYYEVKTVLPPPYEIPKHGATGKVLSALGRHFFRPAHLHVKVRDPKYVEVTSQLYFEGGEYLDNDVANAVRDGLIAKLVRHESSADLAARGLSQPYYESVYDFILAPL